MSLSSADIFAIWAPPESRWSAWAKPVLFVDAPFPPEGPHPKLPAIDGLMRLRNTAVIVDVVGEESVMLGLSLANIGFQPVPLFNGVVSPGEVVEMTDIAKALGWGAVMLPRMRRRPNAPPVFLLNMDRLEEPLGAMMPGRFDNRWAVVPQDMPSAGFLKAAGITGVVLISPTVRTISAHILHSYQTAGLVLERAVQPRDYPVALTVARPAGFRSIWHRINVFAGLRRNAAGGFGAVIPDPNVSGGTGFS